jgi:Flp pilus assembly pilin Flp
MTLHAGCDDGQTTAEYALVLALVLIALIVAFTGLGTAVVGLFDALRELMQ